MWPRGASNRAAGNEAIADGRFSIDEGGRWQVVGGMSGKSGRSHLPPATYQCLQSSVGNQKSAILLAFFRAFTRTSLSQLFQKKSIDKLIADADSPGHRLRKTLGPWSLTALGIGAIIGTGIFILTGTAAAGEVLEVHSILKAPLLDLVMHGTKALGTAGRPGAGPGGARKISRLARAADGRVTG